MYESKKMQNLIESVKKVMNRENITERKVTVPANLMKEFEKLMGKRSSSDQRKLSKLHGLLKKGEINKAWDEYEDLDDDLRLNVVTDRIVQFMDKNLSENINEGKVTVPANLMREFEKLMGKRSSSDQRKLSKLHGLLKKGEIDKAWDAYEDLDDDLRLNVVPDRIIYFMDMNLSR